MPHVIEPAAGATRSMMAFLIAAYDEEEVRGETRTVLRLHPRIAPYKVAVLPLSKKDRSPPWPARCWPRCSPAGCATTTRPRPSAGATGARTSSARPYCVTVDFDSLEDRAVTVRERDSMAQERVPVADLVEHLAERLGW